MTQLREVVQDVEAAFNLKENPRPSDFIIKEALGACWLALATGPQAEIVANLFASIPLSSKGVALGVAPDPSGYLKVVKLVTILLHFALLLLFLTYLCVLCSGAACLQRRECAASPASRSRSVFKGSLHE